MKLSPWHQPAQRVLGLKYSFTEPFAMVFPGDATGAVSWEEKAVSGADVFSPVADSILKMARLKDSFPARI